MNTIVKNLLKIIGIMAYFVVLCFAYTRMNTDRLMNDIEVFAGIFLILGLITLERAYKKDSGKMAISGIELLFLSMHSLSINHVITFYQDNLRFYLLSSLGVVAIYYVLKLIIIYTREKRQDLKNLSDISEIVKEEPIKKEAKKRRKVKNVEQKEDVKNVTSTSNKEDTERNETKEKTKGKIKKEAKQDNKENGKTIKKKEKKKDSKNVTKKENEKEEKNKENENVNKNKKSKNKKSKNKKR